MMARTLAVAVLGAGTMGRGIARVVSAARHRVSLYDVDDAALSTGLSRLRADLERSLRRGDSTEDVVAAILDGITPTTSLAEAVGEADLVIEAAPENLALKQTIFADLARLAPGTAVLATNTSSLSVTAIASAVTTPERVVGLHFFNPVHRLDLVEIVEGIETDTETTGWSREFCSAIGKTAIVVRDRAGFVTSRVNALIGNEAFHMLMEGVASARDIDLGLKHGLHHPMGPFELVDLVGLDTRLAVLTRLRESFGDRFRPNPLLVAYVEAGRLGRKVGRGVYDYDADGNPVSE